MDKLIVTGLDGTKIHGSVQVSGAKNAALPIICAAILLDGKIELTNVPDLTDVKSLCELLESLGAKCIYNKSNSDYKHSLSIDGSIINSTFASYDIVRKMRASVLVLGPLLARFKEATVSLPGGCAIGVRPVDMHLTALEKMGALIEIEDGYIKAKAPDGLKGAQIDFDIVSVGATENIIMAATLADGITTITNAAKEPEVVDLCNMLCAMGAKIDGIGSSTLKITGVKELHNAKHCIIPDRIEAGTFVIMAAALKSDLLIKDCEPKHLESLLDALTKNGVEYTTTNNSIHVIERSNDLKPLNIETAPYPGFPTDLQAQYMTLMTLANGVSIIEENIFENRFMHASELMRMGAKLKITENSAEISGVDSLKPANVMASDLRASISLIIAAASTHGNTIINRIYHLDRGYEDIDNKLKNMGLTVERTA